MATLQINLTREYDVIGYGYSGSPTTAYMTSEWFKVGRQGSSSGAYSKAVITIKNPAFKALQGKGYRINNATIQAWSYNRGNEWQTAVPVQVDGCTNEEATSSTTYNTLPTANVTGVISEVSGWNVYNTFDITNVIQAICNDAANIATLLFYQTTTDYEKAKAYYVTNTTYPIILTVDYDIPTKVGEPTDLTLRKGFWGGDTLFWDGDTTGLVQVSNLLYKVSNVIPSGESLSKGISYGIYKSDGTGGVFAMTGEEVSATKQTALYEIAVLGIYIVLEDNATSDNGITFSEKGIYFLSTTIDATSAAIRYLKINGFSGFAGDTLVWDGDTTGKETIEVSPGLVLCKMSKATPSYSALSQGVALYFNGEELRVERNDEATLATLEGFDGNNNMKALTVIAYSEGEGLTEGTWVITSMFPTITHITGYAGFTSESTTENILSWTAATDGDLNTVTGYEIQYSDDGGATWEALETVGAAVTEVVVYPSSQGKERTFRVRTLGSAGSDFYSNWVICAQTLKISGGKIYVNGKWKNVTNTLVYVNGKWRTVINKKIYVNGKWRTVI